MIGYTTIGTKDLGKALAFYDTLLAELGGKRVMETKTGQLYGFERTHLLLAGFDARLAGYKASQTDAIVPGVQVMREVLSILGPTLDGSSPTSRREWCINTMAADPARKSVLANNEDGILYRWDLSTNTLADDIRITNGLGQAYTPTLIGADGAVYAISNATLYSIRAS